LPAVAVPVGIAYAGLAGFRPEVGLYSSILPLVAYAIFGTSRQLIVGPDAATCALVAASVAPLAARDQATYASLSVMLALLTGLLCIAASFLRLGGLADFLSRPILVWFVTVFPLSLTLGLADNRSGFPVIATGIIRRIVEIVGKLGEIHAPTLAVALATFAVIAIVPRLVPQLPAALVGMLLAAAAVLPFNLAAFGVKTVGYVPAGLPQLVPHIDPALLPALVADAAGVALVSFSSLMLRRGASPPRTATTSIRTRTSRRSRRKYCVGRVAGLRRQRSGLAHRHERRCRRQNRCCGARGRGRSGAGASRLRCNTCRWRRLAPFSSQPPCR
jgi:MFS superfamily sulfate permease-like transporter